MKRFALLLIISSASAMAMETKSPEGTLEIKEESKKNPEDMIQELAKLVGSFKETLQLLEKVTARQEAIINSLPTPAYKPRKVHKAYKPSRETKYGHMDF